MTDLSTSNLKRLLAEATPGPWEARGYYMDGEPRPDDSRQIHGTGGGYLGMMHGTDSHLAALAPELAQEVLRMRREIAELRDSLARTATTCATSGDSEGKLAAGILQNVAEQLFRILLEEGDHDG